MIIFVIYLLSQMQLVIIKIELLKNSILYILYVLTYKYQSLLLILIQNQF